MYNSMSVIFAIARFGELLTLTIISIQTVRNKEMVVRVKSGGHRKCMYLTKKVWACCYYCGYIDVMSLQWSSYIANLTVFILEILLGLPLSTKR